MITRNLPIACLTLCVGASLLLSECQVVFASERVQRTRTINQQISPDWSDAHHFSYRRQNVDGKTETIQVNAATAEMQIVEHADKVQQRGLSGDPVPHSGASQEETEIEFTNATSQTVEIFWIAPSGNRRPYAKLTPGQSHRQHTYAGHAWEVTDKQGNYYGGLVATLAKTAVKIESTFPRPELHRGSERSPAKKTSSPAKQKWQLRIHRDQLQRQSTASDSSDWETLAIANRSAATETSLVSPLLSPDGRVAVVWEKRPSAQLDVFTIESSPQGGGRAKLHRRAYALPGDAVDQFELHAFCMETGNPLSLDLPVFDFGFPPLRWRHDHQIVIEKIDRGHQRFRLFAIDPLNEQVHTPIDESSATFIWTAHRTQLPLLTYLDNEDEVIYASERSGWQHLYLVDLDGESPPQPITQGAWLVRGIAHLDQANRTLDLVVGGYQDGQDPYHRHLIRVDFSGENLVALTHSDGDHEVQYSPDRQYIVVSHSRVDSPPVHELRRTCDGALVTELARAERITNDGKPSRLPTVFSAKGRDAVTDIWGMICFPVDYDASKKQSYPVIEAIYAGPHDSHVPKGYSHRDRSAELTSLGFIVVRIDGMGTANRSKAFHDVCWHNLKDAGFPDRIAWMQAAAKQYPAMDLSRVGIYGTLAGGQNACGALLFHGDFYKAAMASCGCHDNRMDKASWNEQWMGYPVGPQYAASSNIEHAANLTGDLLLLVGELDSNVPPESTLRLVDALIAANKPFDFLIIPGMGHGDGGPYGRQRMREFFVEKLKPEVTH